MNRCIPRPRPESDQCASFAENVDLLSYASLPGQKPALTDLHAEIIEASNVRATPRRADELAHDKRADRERERSAASTPAPETPSSSLPRRRSVETLFASLSRVCNVSPSLMAAHPTPRSLAASLVYLAAGNQRADVVAEAFNNLSVFEQSLLERHANSANSEFGLTDAVSSDAKLRNRWSDILPFNYNRVRLTDTANSSDYINASYIRPKPDRSEKEMARYIATQGPLTETFGDFWSMVWHNGSRVIAMVTNEIENGMVKCHRYFPTKIGEPMAFNRPDGSILTVIMTTEEIAANLPTVSPTSSPPQTSSDSWINNTTLTNDKSSSSHVRPKQSLLTNYIQAVQTRYKSQPLTVKTLTHVSDLIFRSFKLTYTPSPTSKTITGNEMSDTMDIYSSQTSPMMSVNNSFTSSAIQTREVYHVHFSGWPDHGVPRDYTRVLTLIEFTRYINVGSQYPMVAHCSAGCGRTGTLLTIDTVCRQIEQNRSFDMQVRDLVLDTVICFRRDRMSMVQTASQLDYCYMAVANYIAITNLLKISSTPSTPTSTKTTHSTTMGDESFSVQSNTAYQPQLYQQDTTRPIYRITDLPSPMIYTSTSSASLTSPSTLTSPSPFSYPNQFTSTPGNFM